MHYYDLLNLITPILLIYILLFVVLLGQKYLRVYNRNKVLKFTQEEIKEKKREIKNLEKIILQQDAFQHNKNNLRNFDVNEQLTYIYEVFNLYNELAVGINEGLYDELYVKMVMGIEMIGFYKNNYNKINSSIENNTIFMPLELLLKKWDSNEGPSYQFRNNRRYR